MNIIYRQASTDGELRQILQLQQANLPQNISKSEAESQGFVTVEHDFALLQKMNHPHGHVIAVEDDRVVAYALVMLKKWREDIPILVPMFKEIDETSYNNQKLGEVPYFVMGQICVAKEYRAKGVFAGLYEAMKLTMGPHFPFVITEIDANNARSIRAHEKVGFELVKKYKTVDGQEWFLVLLDLRK